MERIDAHQHFWYYDEVRDSWITEEMSEIRQHFLPEHLFKELKAAEFDGCVTVQSDQSEEENSFQLANAEKFDFIRGVVGWVDLQSADVEERLEYYTGFPKLKGFRHVLQGEPQRDLMLQPSFKNGISLLHQYKFTYDLLIFPDQLSFANELVQASSNQRFVIDHLAKPYIKKGEIEQWKRDIEAIAANENVYCKPSGMVTEGAWSGWKKEDFHPYMDVVMEAFGAGRVMYGSDWPVCLVAGSYKQVLGIVQQYCARLSDAEQAAIFGGNAIQFYNL